MLPTSRFYLSWTIGQALLSNTGILSNADNQSWRTKCDLDLQGQKVKVTVQFDFRIEGMYEQCIRYKTSITPMPSTLYGSFICEFTLKLSLIKGRL